MDRMLERLLCAVLLVASPLAAAGPGTDPAPPTPTPPPSTPSPPPATGATAPAAAPTDAEIAHVVVTSNDLDIETAKLAKRRTENPAVLSFAERMITDHTTMNDKAKDLAAQLDLTPTDNPTSQQMKRDHDAMAAILKDLEGGAFDKAYVDSQVTFHANVLDQVDRVLLPNAKDAELKALLEGARPVVAAHLEHARQIQKQLSPSPMTPTSIVE
jgi:putative membrane protein